MGMERIAKHTTYRLTCDNCGRMEELVTESSSEDEVPRPWVGFIPPTRWYSHDDVSALTCGEQCAIDLSVARIRSITSIAVEVN